MESDLTKISTLIETGDIVNYHLALALCKGIKNDEIEGEKLFAERALFFFYSSGYSLLKLCPESYTERVALGIFKYSTQELYNIIASLGKFLNAEANYTKNIINGKNNNT